MSEPHEIDTALEEQDTSKAKLAEVHKRAMRRFDECTPSAVLETRAQSLQARRFITIPGAQWEDEWGEQFDKRLRIEIDKVGRGVRKIENDYRENRIVPDFRPDGSESDAETADMLDGLHRADSHRFKSQQARDNAVFEAISGGFGAYRLANEWEDETDKDNDYQRVNPAALITDADQCVFFDINAKQYDKGDARFCFIRTAYSLDAFKETYGEDRITEVPASATWKVGDWLTPETMSVAEYYEVEQADDTLWICTHTMSGEERRLWSSDLGDGELKGLRDDGWKTKSQRRKRKRVRKYILSGAEVLEDRGHIAGGRIPIVPVYGKRYFVDGVERWQGYVTDKMDAQRLYNSNVSKLAEVNSMSPRARPMFAPEQVDGVIGEQWARADIDNLPYLLAKPLYNEDGSIAQAGPMAYLEPPQMSPVQAALLEISNRDLIEDQQDSSEEVKSNTSAEAMDIAAARVDAKSGIYLDNIRQSVQCEGEIYLGMAAEVYIEPGRVIDTMDEDGGDGQVKLGDAKTDPVSGRHYRINDLQNGRYKVVASVTEATATRRDKTVRSMLNTAQVAITAQDMDLARIAVLTAVMNQDGEGTNDMQAYARKQLVQLGVIQPNDEEKQAMEAQEQQPDPMQEVAKAEAQRLATEAQLNMAEIEETAANTQLKEAQTVETLAKASAPTPLRTVR